MHDGEEKVFPKLSTYNQFDNKKMIKHAMEAGINEGVVMASLDAIPKALKNILLKVILARLMAWGLSHCHSRLMAL